MRRAMIARQRTQILEFSRSPACTSRVERRSTSHNNRPLEALTADGCAATATVGQSSDDVGLIRQGSGAAAAAAED
jgi:hypothetical protein